MVTRRKKNSDVSEDRPPDDDVFDAIEALRTQDERTIGFGLLEVARNLRRLADLLDPREGAGPSRRLGFLPAEAKPTDHSALLGNEPNMEEEWESTSAQLTSAIETGTAGPVGWYLRDVTEFLSRLAAGFAPPPGFLDARIEFRKRRGRPPNSEFWKRGSIALEVMMGTLHYGKQEAAVAEVCRRRGISRATVMRAIKGQGKTGEKSHKKR